MHAISLTLKEIKEIERTKRKMLVQRMSAWVLYLKKLDAQKSFGRPCACGQKCFWPGQEKIKSLLSN